MCKYHEYFDSPFDDPFKWLQMPNDVYILRDSCMLVRLPPVCCGVFVSVLLWYILWFGFVSDCVQTGEEVSRRSSEKSVKWGVGSVCMSVLLSCVSCTCVNVTWSSDGVGEPNPSAVDGSRDVSMLIMCSSEQVKIISASAAGTLWIRNVISKHGVQNFTAPTK